ncbi:Fcf2 pre-rRNA processing-domain-containing protein [Lipomyces tetrasporus]
MASPAVNSKMKKDQKSTFGDSSFLELGDDELTSATGDVDIEDETAVLKRLPKLAPSIDAQNYLAKESGVIRLNSTALASSILSNKLPFRRIADPIKIKQELKEAKEATAGEKWFHMPRTELTPTVKRDMQLLKLRNVLDPKRHYRQEKEKEIPKYFQTGTIVESPTEYFSSRLKKKERKQTLADEILADEKAKMYFKRKYDEIQTVKTSGGRQFYKSIKRKRNRR